MKAKRLCLFGPYVEAYLYFDFLWLFSEDGTVRAFDVAAFCAERLSGDGEAAIALFSDNRLLDQPTGIGTKAKKLLNEGGSYEVSADEADRYSYIFEKELTFRSLLDVRFYYGRAYVGTEAGIVQLAAKNQGDLRETKRGTGQRALLGGRSVSDRSARLFHCRFGAVGAACGRAGGLIGVGANTSDKDWTIQFAQFAESSYALALNGHAITNLARRDRIQLFKTELSEESTESGGLEEAAEDRHKYLVAVSDAAFPLQDERLNELATSSETRGLFLFNRSLWQFDVNGRPKLARFVNADLEIAAVKVSSMRSGPPGRVLSMSSIQAGVLAETDGAVFLYWASQWVPLVEEAVHSVRGYQNSKRYQRIATAVTRDRVEIIVV